MRTAKPRIENLEELHFYINVLRVQCLKKELAIKKSVDYFNNNKGKLLFLAINPLNNKEGKKTVAKIIESTVIPVITSKTGGPLAEIIYRIAGIVYKNYASKSISKLFSKKGKQIQLSDINQLNENLK